MSHPHVSILLRMYTEANNLRCINERPPRPLSSISAPSHPLLSTALLSSHTQPSLILASVEYYNQRLVVDSNNNYIITLITLYSSSQDSVWFLIMPPRAALSLTFTIIFFLKWANRNTLAQMVRLAFLLEWALSHAISPSPVVSNSLATWVGRLYPLIKGWD